MLKNNISPYDKPSILRNINNVNLNLAKEIITKSNGASISVILASIDKYNYEVAEKIWEEFKDNARDYQIRNLFEAANFIDIEFLSDILADNRFKKLDSLDDPKISSNTRLRT